jgi:O-antigen/teichoic acid export membrane protein
MADVTAAAPGVGGRRIAGGVAWTLIANYAVRGVNLLITIALARTIGPAGMGLVAAALLAVEVIDTIRDFGLREALIYEPELNARYADAAFQVILGVSILQALAMAGAAQLGWRVGLDPALAPVLAWLALLFPLSGLGSAQEAMLLREGRFGARALAEMAGVIVKASVALALLRLGHGVWSVVAGMILGIAVRTLALWLFSSWRPGLTTPTAASLRMLLGYGKHIIAVNVMFLCRMKADQFVVAAVLGQAALGVYFVAARIPEIVIFGVNVAITSVAFPTYARIVREKGDLEEAYLRTIRACMLLMAPVALGIAATGDQIVALFFGAEWSDSARILAILSLGGIPLTLGWSAGNVFKATGRPQVLTWLTLIEVLAVSPAIWAVAWATRDLAWIAGAMAAGEAASCALRLAFMSRFERIGAGRTLAAAAWPIIGALVMAAAVLAFAQAAASLSLAFRLPLSILVGVLVYGAVILLFDQRAVAELRMLAASRRA